MLAPSLLVSPGTEMMSAPIANVIETHDGFPEPITEEMLPIGQKLARRDLKWSKIEMVRSRGGRAINPNTYSGGVLVLALGRLLQMHICSYPIKYLYLILCDLAA